MRDPTPGEICRAYGHIFHFGLEPRQCCVCCGLKQSAAPSLRTRGDRAYRIINGALNWYERVGRRTFGPGHVGYRLYYRLFVKGR